MRHVTLFLNYIVFCLFSTFSYLIAEEIIEISSITKILPLINEETWVVIDLDNTVIQATQALGHVDWLQHEVQKLTESGKSLEEALYSLYPIWKKTQMMTDVMPVEASFIKLIKYLQNRHIVVMGLTHRQLFIVSETLRQLDSLDVHFEITAPSKNTFGVLAEHPALYTQGILFVDDFNSKGKVFCSFLQHIGQKPRHMIFIDDKKKNIEDLAKATFLEGIDYIGIHYTAAEHGIQIYSPKLAECQLKFFNRILSNEQARNLLLQKIENQEGKMSDPTKPEYLYKIISQEEWQKSLIQNYLVLSPKDRDFIHLAKEEQVDHVMQKFWNDKDAIILKLATSQLIGRLMYEINPGGSQFYYHLYEGEIPLDAVLDVKVIHVNQ